MISKKDFYFKEALKQAKKAYDIDEIPVGAVIVYKDKIIARAHNKKEHLVDPTAHAEILAIKKASKVLKNWRLFDCDIYVTLKPCLMCLSAINQARIRNVFYILDMKFFNSDLENKNTKINQIEFNKKEYSDILKQFFQKKRTRKQ